MSSLNICYATAQARANSQHGDAIAQSLANTKRALTLVNCKLAIVSAKSASTIGEVYRKLSLSGGQCRALIRLKRHRFFSPVFTMRGCCGAANLRHLPGSAGGQLSAYNAKTRNSLRPAVVGRDAIETGRCGGVSRQKPQLASTGRCRGACATAALHRTEIAAMAVVRIESDDQTRYAETRNTIKSREPPFREARGKSASLSAKNVSGLDAGSYSRREWVRQAGKRPEITGHDEYFSPTARTKRDSQVRCYCRTNGCGGRWRYSCSRSRSETNIAEARNWLARLSSDLSANKYGEHPSTRPDRLARLDPRVFGSARASHSERAQFSRKRSELSETVASATGLARCDCRAGARGMSELPELVIAIEEWSPLDDRGPLCGFATARIPCCGIRMHNISVRRRDDGGYYVIPSGRARFGRDDKIIRCAETGRVSFQPLISFTSAAARARFSDAIVAALIRYGALDGDAS